MTSTVNWARVFNRLFPLINKQGEAYYSGPRFLEAVREVDPYFLSYQQLMDERNQQGKSTSRKDYFYDILLSFSEPERFRLVEAILRTLVPIYPDEVAAIHGELGGFSPVPSAIVPAELWNGERLNDYLRDIDGRIAGGIVSISI